MGDKTGIEWTDATWNPVTGCTKISPGCKFCYAERLTERRGGDFSKIILHPDRLDQPLRWKKPRRIFVNSMSDLFHEEITPDIIQGVFDVMERAKQHQFQVLTKRAERMAALVPHIRQIGGTKQMDRPLPNVWLGVSCENQHYADKRIPLLLQTPAAVRFVSLEPLLGPIDLQHAHGLYYDKAGCNLRKIDWCIVGGESGGPPDRALLKPCNSSDPNSCRDAIGGDGRKHYHPKQETLEWVRSLRDQCVFAGVHFFFKQFGGPTPKTGGRLLDGREWNEMPEQK